MNEFPFIYGLLNFGILFTISFITVFGVKSFLIFLGLLPIKRKTTPKKPPTANPVKSNIARKPRAKIRTVTINPNEVDRIVVKRSDTP